MFMDDRSVARSRRAALFAGTFIINCDKALASASS
jgi:hypothetical protein